MNVRITAPLVALLASLLAACSGSDGGPTIVLYKDRAVDAPREDTADARAGTEAAATRRPVSKPRQIEQADYRVQQGDNLYLIARRHGVPIRSLIEANSLVPPYRLSVGQGLSIPRSTSHVVKQGETLNGIARLHDVGTRELVRLNRLDPPYTVRPGQTLYLPAPNHTARPVQVAARSSNATTNVQPAPASPSPATEGIVATELEPLPNAAEPAPPPRTVKPPAPPPAAQPAAPQPQVAQKALGPRPPRRPSTLQSAAIPKPPARNGTFLWPVRGRVISGFGPKAKGLHNDGINIAAPRGTPIKAAEHGVVAYSGSELRGFGNLVLIRHADGYMTAYGHTADLLVKRGQTVRRGQTIARVGTSGAVSSPQLHFEIRKKKRALDPQRYLGG